MTYRYLNATPKVVRVLYLSGHNTPAHEAKRGFAHMTVPARVLWTRVPPSKMFDATVASIRKFQISWRKISCSLNVGIKSAEVRRRPWITG